LPLCLTFAKLQGQFKQGCSKLPEVMELHKAAALAGLAALLFLESCLFPGFAARLNQSSVLPLS
jgi:hypothetical protein